MIASLLIVAALAIGSPAAKSAPEPNRRDALRAELAAARANGENDRAVHVERALQLEETKVA